MKKRLKKNKQPNYWMIISLVVIGAVVLFVAFDTARFLLADSNCEEVSFSPGSENDAGYVRYAKSSDGKGIGNLQLALEEYLIQEGFSKSELESEISRLEKNGDLDNVIITEDFEGGLSMTGTGECTRLYSKVLVDRSGNPLYKCVNRGDGCDGRPCVTLFGRDRVSSSVVNWCVCS